MSTSLYSFEDDSMAVLDSPGDLYIPVPEPSVPLVSLPELDETDARRPDLPSAFQSHPWVIPTGYPRPGTFVVTSRNTLRAGRWIRGKFSSICLNGGVVIDVVPRQFVAQWLCCKPLLLLSRPTKSHFRLPYRICIQIIVPTVSGTSLTLNSNLTIIDLQSPPRGETLRSSESALESPVTSSGQEVKPATLHQDLKSWRLRCGFRDSSAAAVKYQGREAASSGRFNKIDEESTHGWDLNIFKVISKKTENTSALAGWNNCVS